MQHHRYPFLDLQNKKHKDSENTKQIMSSSKHQLSPMGIDLQLNSIIQLRQL